jgi:hypothetical protein
MSKQFQDFMKTLLPVVVCPYCCQKNQLDPPLPCCDEVHAEEAWLNSEDEVILESELETAFKEWLNTETGEF